MARTQHGHFSGGKMSPTYVSWVMMKQRCLNPNYTTFWRYGGKGITVCKEWLNFNNFLSDMGERPSGTSIDRKDGTKGYYPENCRWATKAEQSRNKCNNIFISYDGKTKIITEWSTLIGMKVGVLYSRFHRNCTTEQILGLQPVPRAKIISKRPKVSDFQIPDVNRRSQMRFLHKNGCTYKEIGNHFGISKQRVHQLM
jgi:hypothetical protein